MAIFKEADVTSSNMADRIGRYPRWLTGCDVSQDGRPDVTSSVKDICSLLFTLLV